MIHSTAIISPEAKLGSNVSIGPYSIIYPNTVIGDNTTIGSHCEIGHPTPLAQGVPLTLGAGSLIRSHSIFYEGSTFGEKLVTGHRVTAREATRRRELPDWHALRHPRPLLHRRLRPLSQQCTHRAAFHHRQFRLDLPYVVLTNDPHPPSEVMSGATVQDYAAIATMSILLPGVTVGKGALVGAHSSVNRDVAADTVVAGSPAKFICETSKVKLKDGSGNAAYPWRKHFHRGYPEEVVTAWLNEFSPPASN